MHTLVAARDATYHASHQLTYSPKVRASHAIDGEIDSARRSSCRSAGVDACMHFRESIKHVHSTCSLTKQDGGGMPV
jgi:hypothetical protein